MQNHPTTTTFRKLRKRIRRNVGRAIEDFSMIENGDRIMVCLSGGKDSYTLLDVLLQLRDRAPVEFDLVAVHMDQKQPGYDATILPEYLSRIGIEWHVIEKDTYSIVKDIIPEGKTMCSLCSRLRRGTLYGFAEAHDISKIALGHHRDDMMETLFLNLFHGGSLKSMPPKLQSDSGKNIVIRPLAYCEEKDIAKYAEQRAFPIIPCNLCGSQENLQRQNIKAMLQQWDKEFPRRLDSIFAGLSNVAPSQLADRELFDFNAIGSSKTQGVKWLPEGSNKDSSLDINLKSNRDIPVAINTVKP